MEVRRVGMLDEGNTITLQKMPFTLLMRRTRQTRVSKAINQGRVIT